MATSLDDTNAGASHIDSSTASSVEAEYPEAEAEAAEPSIPAAQGGLSIDEKLDFEVHLLAIASLRAIANDVAKRVQTCLSGHSDLVLFLGDSSLAAAMTDWRILWARILSLREAFDELFFEVTPEDAEGVEVAPIGELAGAISAISNVLSHFAVDTAWMGRNVDVDAALRPALLGQLIEHGIEPISVDRILYGKQSIGDDNLIRVLRRLLDSKAKVELLIQPVDNPPNSFGDSDGKPAQAPGPEQQADERNIGSSFNDRLSQRAASLSAAVDKLVVDIQAYQPEPRLLLEASEACSIVDASPAAYMLEATVVRAGGHYKLRKHLLTYVFGLDGLTYGAGAVVAYSLTDIKRGRVVLADTLFHGTDSVRFGANPRMVTPNNLLVGRTDDAGLTPLPMRPAGVGKDVAASKFEHPGFDERRVTPNAADDESADDAHRVSPEESDEVTEGIPQWRLAECLRTLLNQVNAKAPARSIVSDGSIGDAAHQTRESDHNPWVREGNMGIVTAIDVTNDPTHGCSAEALAETLRSVKDPRIKYIIWNRRIAYSRPVNGAPPWVWSPYGGKNPHNKHIHISVKSEKKLYDSAAAWRIN